MTATADPQELFENEWYAVRFSGELPEVALHGALHYLTTDRNGPRLVLTASQRFRLLEAAELRYLEIILRDLQQANRKSTAYRGVQRSIVNWHRWVRFCSRQGREQSRLRSEVANALLSFVRVEMEEAGTGARDSCINCSFDELSRFAVELGLAPAVLPPGLQRLCR